MASLQGHETVPHLAQTLQTLKADQIQSPYLEQPQNFCSLKLAEPVCSPWSLLGRLPGHPTSLGPAQA